jgi:hypothetical protein
MIKDMMPICEIPPGFLQSIFEERWINNQLIDSILIQSRFTLKNLINEEMEKKIVVDIFDVDKLKKVFLTR